MDVEAHLLRVNDMLDRNVDFSAWRKDVSIVEEEQAGVPEWALQSQVSAEMVSTNEHI
jgi:hypothetical protein